ncbi:hypothetical protein Tco_0828685 [Tanacetum coccineum]
MEKMAEEDRHVKVAVVPKFDMPHHKFKMSSKDVKSSAKKYNILLDLHPCAPSEGWTMDQLSEETIGKGAEGKIFQETFSRMKGWKDKFFFLDQRAIPDAMAWRHHDSGVNDMLSEDGFRMEDVRTFSERVMDLPITMSEYLCFHFLSGVSIGKGTAISAINRVEPNTTPPLSVGEPILEKTDAQLKVEVDDPKVVADREKKKSQAAKKVVKNKESKKRVNNEGDGSKAKTKRRKTPARTQDAPKDDHNSNRLSPRKLANESVHNYVDIDGGNTKESPPRLEPFVNLSRKPLNADKEEVFLSSQSLAHHTLSFRGPLSQPREILKGLHAEDGESSRSDEIYVPKWGILRRLARGAMAQSDILERFENLQDDYIKLAETHEEHTGCGEKFKALEKEKNELSAVNKDQALRIQELEAELAKKDSALVFTERMSAEGAVEQQKLVAQLSQAEAGWERGLSEGCTEEEILAALHAAKGFDAYSDKKPYV